ncbi:MAG TPA: hypothetical protein VKN99_28095 [Polyangia bacterium]|nr:hypothetical protein [Polyangia bacterium]
MPLPSLPTILILSALAASILLLLRKGPRLVALIALVASSLEALIQRGWLHIGLKVMPLGLILGGALAVAGAILFTRSSVKSAVAASTVVAFVGLLQLLAALHAHG